MDILLPALYLLTCYFIVPLDDDAGIVFTCLGIVFLCSWMSSAYGLLVSTIFRDFEVTMSLVPVIIVPLLLLGGFFAPL